MRHMWTINMGTDGSSSLQVTLCTQEREKLSRARMILQFLLRKWHLFSVISGVCQWPHDNVVTSSWHRVTARMWPDFLIIKTVWCCFSPSSESCAALHTPGAWCWTVSEQTIGSRNIWPGDSSDGNDPVLAHAEGHRCPAPASPATADTCHWCQQRSTGQRHNEGPQSPTWSKCRPPPLDYTGQMRHSGRARGEAFM